MVVLRFKDLAQLHQTERREGTLKSDTHEPACLFTEVVRVTPPSVQP